MSGNSYILAMYDVRGKQEFIYRSSKIKEIVGGSMVIRDIFDDYLFSQGGGRLIYSYDSNAEVVAPFRVDEMKKRFSEGYVGEVVYEGGGNLMIIFKDRDSMISCNKKFTHDVIKATSTLTVLCCDVKIDDSFSNFPKDRERLYDEHTKVESSNAGYHPCNALPITKVDHNSSMPIVEILKENNLEKEVSRESLAKLSKYNACADKENLGEKVLDNIVHEKGEDSLLAVVYIDGNSMGAKVQKCLEGEEGGNKKDSSYDASVTRLREFSSSLNKEYVSDRKLAIEAALANRHESKETRFLVASGDEMTFICQARDAYTAIKAYFSSENGVNYKGFPEEDHSSCAGIAIFHSHAPYADAYRIAEECCESGKKYMKDNGLVNTCLMDFHYCQTGIGLSLEEIRKREVENLGSKPWIVRIGKEDESNLHDKTKFKIEDVEKIAGCLNEIARTNIKGLLPAAKESLSALKLECGRIKAHTNKDIESAFDKTSVKKDDDRRKLIYDIVSAYDWWFREEK